MKIKITMVNGDMFSLDICNYDTLSEFLDNQVAGNYYTLDVEKGIAIRTSNILKIEHLDLEDKK